MSHRSSLVVIFLTVFIDLLGFGMVLPLLPLYGKEFARQLQMAESDGQIGLLIGLLMSSFSIMQFIFSPIWGRLSDRWGRRPVLLVGLAGSVVCYTLFGIATVEKSLLMLFLSRIGAGIAGATISTAQAYIADSTPNEGRARGMALIGAAFGLGFTFGPLFGYLAVPTGTGDPGPGPGYAAAGLSLVALLLAWFRLPESLQAENRGASGHVWSRQALLDALSTPTIPALLATLFVCVFSFANFESTLSLLVKDEHGPFQFTFRGVCLTFAFVGLTLSIIQGGIVRRLSLRVSEASLALFGAALEIVGFGVMAWASQEGSTPLLFTSLVVVVGGFACLTPSLNSLVSRRSDPQKQGGILGVAQSVTALARILGPMTGVPLFHLHATWPLLLAAALMGLGLLLVVAARRGHDFSAHST